MLKIINIYKTNSASTNMLLKQMTIFDVPMKWRLYNVLVSLPTQLTLDFSLILTKTASNDGLSEKKNSHAIKTHDKCKRI